jgi:hypothetical protein
MNSGYASAKSQSLYEQGKAVGRQMSLAMKK